MIALLRLLPIGAQIGIGVAVLVAIGGGYYAWRSGVFDKGVQYERAQQKERDDEAVEHARDGRLTVRDCYDRGGVWDASRGVCNGR